MCLAVYIGAKTPLPVVAWSDGAPGFYVTDLLPDDEPVRAHFTVAHVYYAGAHEGCGCGFNVGTEYSPDSYEPAELSAAAESRARLARYLQDALASSNVLEVYACWEGEQAAPVESRRQVRPRDFADAAFFFTQRELLDVKP